MTATAIALPVKKGMSFLLEDTAPQEIFTREDLSDEHRAVAQTVADFWAREVEPNLPAIRDKQPGVALEVLRKSVPLGLTGISIPEEYGGMAMDLASVMIVAEHLGRDASYAGWHSAHTGIGSLPVLFFGTPEQKKKYLPKLVSVEMLAAYALTEPLAGSDALAARTRADLSDDKKHYILNGQKMWITNGGAADLFTVFAKVGGEQFTAFLVERGFGGVTSGAEEHKMGITGSSTTAVYFDNVRVPVENVLGEIGRGHVIAFNILNLGRLKLGPAVIGSAKSILSTCLKYAKQRKAFGSSIAEFGAIQHKLAEMTIRIFAAESMVWRVVGLIEARLAQSAGQSGGGVNHAELKAVEEYAAECSMVKVFAAEMIDYVADEGIQIHGGYGFHKDYSVERTYRDARINRLFEGTSEINRLVIAGMTLKRAAKGDNALLLAASKALTAMDAKGAKEKPELGTLLSDESSTTQKDVETRLVRNAKQIALLTLGLAQRKYSSGLDKQQEVIMNISDIFTEAFAMESTLLRSRKLGASGTAAGICKVFLRDAMGRIASASQTVLGACCEGEEMKTSLARVNTLAAHEPVNSIAIRREIAAQTLGSEKYLF